MAINNTFEGQRSDAGPNAILLTLTCAMLNCVYTWCVIAQSIRRIAGERLRPLFFFLSHGWWSPLTVRCLLIPLPSAPIAS